MTPHSDATGPRRIVVGISGASGAVYGVRVLVQLARIGVETHLVMSRSSHLTVAQELSMQPSQVQELASVSYRVQDIGAAISSGSFKTLGMIIAPCSIRTLSEIATGVTSSLLTRAADVVLKERGKLVLLVRETPLHLGHLRSLTELAEMGAIIMPPVPAMYALPNSIEQMVDHTVGRALDLFGLDAGTVTRWQGLGQGRAEGTAPED